MSRIIQVMCVSLRKESHLWWRFSFGSSSQKQQFWLRAPKVSPQSPWSFSLISLPVEPMELLNCLWRNSRPLLFYSSFFMQSSEIIEDKMQEFQCSPSPHSNSLSFPFCICKNGNGKNGNNMLLLGYLVVMLLSLLLVLLRKKMIFKK